MSKGHDEYAGKNEKKNKKKRATAQAAGPPSKNRLAEAVGSTALDRLARAVGSPSEDLLASSAGSLSADRLAEAVGSPALDRLARAVGSPSEDLLASSAGLSTALTQSAKTLLHSSMRSGGTPEILNVTRQLSENVDQLGKYKMQSTSLKNELLSIKSKLGRLQSELEKNTSAPVEKSTVSIVTADDTSEVKVDVETEAEGWQAQWRLEDLEARVSDIAFERMKNNPMLFSDFIDENEQSAFIFAVDIRKSTDLMLKATSPQKFAEFITELTLQLEHTIKKNFGVFDKFTGDGILAYFPECISGVEAGLFAANAAAECHTIFNEIYGANHDKFSAVPSGTGLGIGIDYGAVCTVWMNTQLTVVGKPVVYACRLSGADAGQTLVNQQALRELRSFDKNLEFEKTVFVFKHEGEMVVHSLKLSKPAHELVIPDPFSEELVLTSESSAEVAQTV